MSIYTILIMVIIIIIIILNEFIFFRLLISK